MISLRTKTFWIDRVLVSDNPARLIAIRLRLVLAAIAGRYVDLFFRHPLLVWSPIVKNVSASLALINMSERSYRIAKGTATLAGVFLGALIYLLSISTLLSPILLLIPLFAAAGFLLTDLVVADRLAAVEYEMHGDFPRFLDLLHLYTSSAAYENIGSAMYSVASSMRGALAKQLLELTRMYRFVDTSRFLDEMEHRFAIPLAKDLVATLRLAEVYGGSISQKIGVLAEESHKDRLQKARKAGQRASATLMIPLMIFHFPVAIIIFLAPTALALKEAFGW